MIRSGVFLDDSTTTILVTLYIAFTKHACKCFEKKRVFSNGIRIRTMWKIIGSLTDQYWFKTKLHQPEWKQWSSRTRVLQKLVHNITCKWYLID